MQIATQTYPSTEKIVTAPFKVGNFGAGESRSEVSKQWIARPALASYAEGSVQKLVDGVAKAKAAKVASDEESAIDFLRQRDFSKKRVTEILEAVEREEGRPARTIWDFAQGITAVARLIPNTDDRLATELVAKKMLDKVAA